QFQYKNLQLNFGASLVGISRVIDNGEFQSNDDYLYNFNWNASAAYTIKKWNTTASMYYKFTGKSQQYVAGSQGFVLSDIDSYSWMDASLQKAFNNNKWEVTIGARNLFNITNIEQTNLNQGGGHAVASQILLGYGTSYFARLTYNLNF
ncbi:MAG: outer membrane beta-barrel family protein, partial [Flavobacterium sp.]|nr:outer membrane beta-barrel family protein [Flavobacterium sp.]